MSKSSLLNKVEKNFYQSIEDSMILYCLSEKNEDIAMFQESFLKSLKKLRENEENKTGREKVGYFPVAGDPIHWAHLLTAFKILADFSLDKVVLISAGYDPRKPKLVHPKFRFPMIEEAIKIFEGLFELSDITLNEKFALEKGEDNIFNILAKKKEPTDAFYIVGSDHYNWTVVGKDGVERADTLKTLSDNMSRKDFDKEKHSITSVFIRRDDTQNKPSLKELQPNLPSLNYFNIRFNVPDFAYSSTQIRDGFKVSDLDQSVVYVPACVYPFILENNLYKN